MNRPTFPARNQWEQRDERPSSVYWGADKTHAAAPPAAHGRPANSAPLRARRAPIAHWLVDLPPMAPEPYSARVVPVNTPGTVGNTGQANSTALRQHMVQALQAQGLRDARVIHALLQVERHCFVDSALLGQAYADTSLPIGLGQTISKPSVVARMAELLLAAPAMQAQPPAARMGRILEIGTGCGYQASVLSHLATEVYSIERLKALHDKARHNLRPFRVANIHLLLGDGMLGYAAGAPYAGIIAAAGGDAIPPAWLEQLATGGRLVAPMRTGAQAQSLVVVDKTAQGLQHTVLEPVLFVPLKSGVA